VTPETIAHYRISSKLGEGAMGEVYRATDSKLGREVAIKLIPEDFAKDSTRMARFTREAQVLASLNHPNIAAIYGVEDRALIMELVEGQTLQERIKQGPIPLDEALEIARQIADGLEAAHEKGIVHRDLKPANIKITPGGTIKLLDFGLAKSDGPWTSATAVEDAPTLTVASTGTGVILGTAAYMAPEQARGRNVDKRADVWAFGVILYEMLSGAQPFTGETITDVLASVVRHDPDLDTVPARVRSLLRRCLEKDPKKRLRDAGDAMLLLEPAGGEVVAPSRHRGPLWTAVAVAAVLLAALAWLASIHFRETPPLADAVRFAIELPPNVTFSQFGAFAVSPDGKSVAFSAFGADGVPRIWVRTLDTLTARSLPDSETTQIVFPFFWSPDSRFLAFESEGKLKKVDVTGGSVQVLADVRQTFGGSWNSNGVIIVGTNTGVMRVSAEGGTPTKLTSLPERQVDTHPVFLPDNRHFLYVRGSGNAPDDRVVLVGDIEAKPEAQSTTPLMKARYGVAVVPAVGATPTQMMFLRDGTLFTQTLDTSSMTLVGEPSTVAQQVADILGALWGQFSVSRTGTLVYRTITGVNRQLTWFDRQGQIVGRPGEPAPFGQLKLSPDGMKASVVEVSNNNADIWIIDLAKGSSTRLTFDPGNDGQPVWSPDGGRIAWRSNRGNAWGIYQKAVDGSGADELLHSFPLQAGAPQLTDWTHDGRFLVFAQANDIWALPLQADASGKREPMAIVKTPAQELGAYVSQDSKWIAYISNETGTQEIFVQPFAGGAGQAATGKWMVSRGTTGMARWRADGKELIYLSGDGAVMSVDVTPGSTFQASQPRKLFSLPLELLGLTSTPGGLADVTRDHERLLLVMPIEESAQRELSVFMNWPSSLKK